MEIFLRLLIVVLLLLYITIPIAQGQQSRGNNLAEFVVAEGPEKQDHATVALFDDGAIAVTWHSWMKRASDRHADVYYALYDRTGSPIGGPFLVNQGLSDYDSRAPDIAAYRPFGDGLFVITWAYGWQKSEPGAQNDDIGLSYPSGVTRIDSLESSAPVFNAPSSAIRGEFNVYVNLYKTGQEKPLRSHKVSRVNSETMPWPDVTMFDDGRFMVVWSEVSGDDQNFRAMLYDSSGDAVYAQPFQLNDKPASLMGKKEDFIGLPDVDCNDNDRVVAVWEQFGETSGFLEIFFRFFDASDPIQASSISGWIKDPLPERHQRRPMVDLGNDDQILVTWTESRELSDRNNMGESGEVYFVHGFRKSGVTPWIKWSEKICPHKIQGQRMPGVRDHRSIIRFVDESRFLVAWTHQWYDSDERGDDIYFRLFTINETPGNRLWSGLPVYVHHSLTSRSRNQQRPAIDLILSPIGELQLVMIWEEDDPSTSKSRSDWDIFGRCYFAKNITSFK